MISRRTTFKAAAGAAAAAAWGAGPARAADKTIKIGIDLSFTGADGENATRIANGAILAFEQANASGAVKGYKFDAVKFDDATATAGQYDPAQAATNARAMVSDKGVLAAVGPQMSGAGKAMAPILSQGRPRDHHPKLDQPGHHQPEIRRTIPSGRQGDLLPHGRDRRVPRPEHGQLHGRYAEGEVGFRAR